MCRESMRRKRKAARAAAGSAVPISDRKALAGKLKSAAASLKATKPTAKTAKKKNRQESEAEDDEEPQGRRSVVGQFGFPGSDFLAVAPPK